MFDFTTIDEVKLARGSHGSAAEGMCFMEMTAWFAGEAHSDKPDCACPILGAYGIWLNDEMPDDLRDRLLKPMVPLIAGTNGDYDDRLKRVRFLAFWTVTRILPVALRAAGLEKEAAACEGATDLAAAYAAAKAYAADAAADAAAYAAKAYAAAYAAADAAAYAAKAYDADAAYAAAKAAAKAAAYAAYAAKAYAAKSEIYTIAIEGLRQAILIGRHDGFGVAVDLVSRHQALRDLVAA